MMMRKLIPILLALLGLGAGLAAGYVLRAKPGHEAEGHAPPKAAAPAEYVKLNNQFVVPVIEGGRVASLVVLSLSLEIAPETSEAVFAREPKLRDAFLQVLFDHANSGGFRGSFTDATNLVFLRRALREQAISVIGPSVSDVLITEIARQDN